MLDPLTKQFNNKKFSNIILKVQRKIDDKYIEDILNCNTIILASYSKTFEKMFSDIEDNGKLTIDLTHLNYDSLEIWLKYMYKNTLVFDDITNVDPAWKPFDKNDQNKKDKLLNLLIVYQYLDLEYDKELKNILNLLARYNLIDDDITQIIQLGYVNNESSMNDRVYEFVRTFVNSLNIKKELTTNELVMMKSIDFDNIYDKLLKTFGSNNILTTAKYLFIYYRWIVTRDEDKFLKHLDKINICYINNMDDREFVKQSIGKINSHYPIFIEMIWKYSKY